MNDTHTTETYDFHKNDNLSWFNHLLLDSDHDKVVELSKQKGFDPDKLEIRLEVNGTLLRIEDFNNILRDWANRLSKQIKDEVEYNNSEEAVIEKAKELINTKMGKVHEALSEIEESLWKLED